MSETEARVQRLERVLEISRELSSTTALEPLLLRIVKIAAELTGSEGASILLLDTRTGELRFRAACGSTADELAEIPVPIRGSIAGAVLDSGRPLIISDARRDPRHYRRVGLKVGLDIDSLLAVPLHVKDRRIGVLEAINKSAEGGFSNEDIEILATMASQAAIAIENARLLGALREAYERLGELDELKSEFIAIASHELRTPLGLILGYAAFLRESLEDTAAEQLDVVLRAALRLRHIIETMLNLRYLETGELMLSHEYFDLCGEVAEACGSYRSLAEAHGLKLEVSCPESPIAILADREKLRVVLDNLLSNAVKFTSTGGRITVTVELVAHQPDEVKVTVADTGIGIPAEELERVFGRFEQVEDHMSRRYGGMGLGLAIVKGLVELHGGRVWAESVPEQGSRFQFVLPVVSPPGDEEKKRVDGSGANS